MSAGAGDEFGFCEWCQADQSVYCLGPCENVPDWFYWACTQADVDPRSPFAAALFYTCAFYTDDRMRGARVIHAAGPNVPEEFGAAFALGGKAGALAYLWGLALPGVDASGQYAEFAAAQE